MAKYHRDTGIAATLLTLLFTLAMMPLVIALRGYVIITVKTTPPGRRCSSGSL